jgi:membrane carboxypeptidase/penicillin-binding protein
MRVFLWTCLIAVSAIALLVSTVFGWLFFSGALPGGQGLAQFAPVHPTRVSDPCLTASLVAIPYESIGNNLRAALSAAEFNAGDPGVLMETYQGFSDQNHPHHPTLSQRIAREMFCEPSRTLSRQVEELRAAVQLERRFSSQDLFTIFANRLVFSKDIVGVEAASQHFFHKAPNQLLVEEAALLAGLVTAPSYLSPIRHPDRALRRRNEVIDQMLEVHAITESTASAAKGSPLPIMID